MKIPLLISLAALLFAVGCSDNSNSSTPQTNSMSAATNAANETSPTEAPAGYLGGLSRAQQLAVKTVDTARIHEAIQMFHVEKGRFPRNLNELVQAKYLPKIPPAPAGMKLVYNPTTGQVGVARQ